MRDAADHADTDHAGAEAAVPGRRGAGELEAAVLEVLQRGGSALSPGEVRELIGGDLAYTTVVTILRSRQGVLDRTSRAAPTSTRRLRRLAGPGRRRIAVSWTKRRTARPSWPRFVSSLSGRDEELLRRISPIRSLDGPGLDGGG